MCVLPTKTARASLSVILIGILACSCKSLERPQTTSERIEVYVYFIDFTALRRAVLGSEKASEFVTGVHEDTKQFFIQHGVEFPPGASIIIIEFNRMAVFNTRSNRHRLEKVLEKYRIEAPWPGSEDWWQFKQARRDALRSKQGAP